MQEDILLHAMGRWICPMDAPEAMGNGHASRTGTGVRGMGYMAMCDGHTPRRLCRSMMRSVDGVQACRALGHQRSPIQRAS